MIRADEALEFVYLKYGANVVHSIMGALSLVLLMALWDGLIENKFARFSMIWVFVAFVIITAIGLRHATWHTVRFDMFNKAEREMAKEEGRHSEEFNFEMVLLALILLTSLFVMQLGPVIYKWVFRYYTFWGETVIPGVGPSPADYGF